MIFQKLIIVYILRGPFLGLVVLGPIVLGLIVLGPIVLWPTDLGNPGIKGSDRQCMVVELRM